MSNFLLFANFQVIYLTGELLKRVGSILEKSTLPITFDVAAALKKSMLDRKISSYPSDKYMALATVLDPRFKLLGLHTEESRANAKALLRAEIMLVFSIFSSFFPQTYLFSIFIGQAACSCFVIGSKYRLDLVQPRRPNLCQRVYKYGHCHPGNGHVFAR